MADTDFIIPDGVLEKFPELTELIKATDSMNVEEKNYWFQLLPIMTDEQVKNLYDILDTEKKKLQEIDAKYSGEASDKKPFVRMTPQELAQAEKVHEDASSERKKEEGAAESQEEQEEKKIEESFNTL